MLKSIVGTLDREHLYTQAQKAKDYARGIILVSRTSPEENTKEATYKNAHNACIQHMRSIAMQSWKDPLHLESNSRVLEYEAFVTASAKYSIGNCSELCLHVLDYYLKHDPEHQTRVELFCLADPSDHVFVVINRERNSDEDNPLTWGKDAFICDPLMNTLYPAEDYKEKLMDFEYELQQNTYIPFNDAEHHLQAVPGFSSDYLAEHRQVWHLVDCLQQKLNILHSILQTHHDTLQSLQTQMKTVYGSQSNIHHLLSQKVDALKQQIHLLAERLLILPTQTCHQLSYREAYTQLYTIFETAYTCAVNCIRFNEEETAILSQQPNSALGKFFGLFHQTSPAYAALEKALASCQIDLQTRVLTHRGMFYGGT